LATDNLVLAGRIEDEVAHLEVYVYEDEDDNLYVHHDIMLPAIPLTVEWLDLPVGKAAQTANGKGNFVAIGTMDPDIEIWNLDVVDSMYPDAVVTTERSLQPICEHQMRRRLDGVLRVMLRLFDGILMTRTISS
jgi:hypothetical protein